MTSCSVHTRFFDDDCSACKKEYNIMKCILDASNSASENNQNKKRRPNITKYKEFTEERAKKLYEELLLQYIQSSSNEIEAAEKARRIIRKQCSIRGMPFWAWI